MDLNAKIAARREELARLERQQRADEAAASERLRVADQQRRAQALDDLASDLTDGGEEVRREGDELVLASSASEAFDVEGLKRSAIERLVRREARRLWTPRDNWIVIGGIVGGVCLLHVGGLGLVPLAVGFLVRSSINKHYRAAVRERIPSLS